MHNDGRSQIVAIRPVAACWKWLNPNKIGRGHNEPCRGVCKITICHCLSVLTHLHRISKASKFRAPRRNDGRCNVDEQRKN